MRPAAIFRTVTLCLAVLLAAGADEPPSRDAEPEPLPPLSRQLPVDIEVLDAFRRVDRLIRERKWDGAIETLQMLIESPQTGLCQAPDGSYLSVSEYAHRMLADLPEEGRRAYLGQYGADARHSIESGLARRDPFPIERAHRRYRTVPGTIEALRTAAAFHLDRGEVEGALRCLAYWERSASSGREADRMRVLLFLRMRQVSLAEQILDRLPEEEGRRLREEFGIDSAGAGRTGNQEWSPGSDLGFRWLAQYAHDLKELPSVRLESIPEPAVSIDGESIYVCDGASVAAVNARNGIRTWTSAPVPRAPPETPGGTGGGIIRRGTVSNVTVHPVPRRPVVLDRDHCYAALRSDPTSTRWDTVACFRPPSRNPVWTVQTEGEADIDAASPGSGFRIHAGPRPTPYGILLLVSREGIPAQDLVSLDPETGRPLWRLRISNAERTAKPTAIVAGNDTAYVMTGTGVLTAVDLSAGALLWARILEEPPGNRRARFNNNAGVGIVAGIPLLLAREGDRLLAADPTAEAFVCVDPYGGAVRWSTPWSPLRSPSGRPALFGSREGKVFLYGNHVVSIEVDDGDLVWPSVEIPAGEPVSAAFVGDFLLLNTDGVLVRLDRESGLHFGEIALHIPEGLTGLDTWDRLPPRAGLLPLADGLLVYTSGHLVKFAPIDGE